MFKRMSENTTVEKLLKKEDQIPPEILIDIEVLAKMKSYVDQCDTEIAWLAACKKESDRLYHIYDVFTCKQDVSGVTAELHEAGLQELAERLIAEGRSDELSNIRVWGHSHVHMQVRPSGTDDETFQEYYSNCEYFIRMILNKKGDMAIDIMEAERELIFYNVEWNIHYPDDLAETIKQQEILVKQIAEIEKHIQTEVKAICDMAEQEGRGEVKQYTTALKQNRIGNKPKYMDRDCYNQYEGYTTVPADKTYAEYNICNICGKWEDTSFGIDFNDGDYICSTCSDELEKDSSINLRICIGEKNEDVVPIYEICSLECINDISLSSISEVEKGFRGWKEFTNYTTEDWKQLQTAAKNLLQYLW